MKNRDEREKNRNEQQRKKREAQTSQCRSVTQILICVKSEDVEKRKVVKETKQKKNTINFIWLFVLHEDKQSFVQQ